MSNRHTSHNSDLTTPNDHNNNHISLKPRLSKLHKFRRILVVFILPVIMGLTFDKCENPLAFFRIPCDFNPQISYNDYCDDFCVTSDGKIFELRGCGTFDLEFQVPGEPALNSIFCSISGGTLIRSIAVGEIGTIVRGVPSPSNWKVVKSPTTQTLWDVCSYRAFNSNYFAVGEGGVVIKSSDKGESWFLVNSPTSLNLYRIDCIGDNTVQVYGGDYSAYRSEDGGITWETISPPLVELPGFNVNSNGPLDITASFFLNDSTGYIFGSFGLTFFTSDGGSSWLDRHAFEFERINTAHFTSVDSGMIAGDNGKIRFTTDGGLSWLEDTTASNITTQNINNVFVRDDSVAVVVGDSGLVVFAATDSSLIVPVELISFAASVNGTSVTLDWATATELNNSGFEVQRTFCSKDSWVKIGFVDGHGTTTERHNYSYVDVNLLGSQYMYRLKQIDFNGQYEYSDVVEVEIMPEEYALYQNYPNPFNPETIIRFNIPSASPEFVSLIVYDLLGNEIKRLVYDERTQGSYQVIWDGRNESGVRAGSGVYLYGLVTKSFRQYNKMVLLK